MALFLYIDGIKGSSEVTIDGRHIIELSSVYFNVSTSSGSDTPTISGLSFTKPFDATSPELFIGVATGKHFKGATLYITTSSSRNTATPTVVAEFDFDEVVLTSLSESSSGDTLEESIYLEYSRVEISYTGGGSTDAVAAGYDTRTKSVV